MQRTRSSTRTQPYARVSCMFAFPVCCLCLGLIPTLLYTRAYWLNGALSLLGTACQTQRGKKIRPCACVCPCVCVWFGNLVPRSECGQTNHTKIQRSVAQRTVRSLTHSPGCSHSTHHHHLQRDHQSDVRPRTVVVISSLACLAWISSLVSFMITPRHRRAGF